MRPESLTISYLFQWKNGQTRSYEINLDAATGRAIPKDQPNLPAWTRLETARCANCKLDPQTSPHCPVAVNLHDLVVTFQESVSTDMVMVSVATKGRTYTKEVPAQRGVQSIFGLIMATSGCPTLDFLRPMARFHQPFSSTEETIVRVVSFYLLSQYYTYKAGGAPDWELRNLETMYTDVSRLNHDFIKRVDIAQASASDQSYGDAIANAISRLDVYSQMILMELDSQLPLLAPVFVEQPPG
ncbi:MAG: hypothetical protein NT062_15475 [Proteobacteria bacterium]|nr:hypothetical protein [Pseudomonadota bacterium]